MVELIVCGSGDEIRSSRLFILFTKICIVSDFIRVSKGTVPRSFTIKNNMNASCELFGRRFARLQFFAKYRTSRDLRLVVGSSTYST